MPRSIWFPNLLMIRSSLLIMYSKKPGEITWEGKASMYIVRGVRWVRHSWTWGPTSKTRLVGGWTTIVRGRWRYCQCVPNFKLEVCWASCRSLRNDGECRFSQDNSSHIQAKWAMENILSHVVFWLVEVFRLRDSQKSCLCVCVCVSKPFACSKAEIFAVHSQLWATSCGFILGNFLWFPCFEMVSLFSRLYDASKLNYMQLIQATMFE